MTMSVRPDPKHRGLRATSVDIHALLREVLGARKEAIISAGLRVSLELNASRSQVDGADEMLRDLMVHGLESVLSPAARGDRLVLATSSDERRLKLRLACGTRVFETELMLAHAQLAPGDAGREARDLRDKREQRGKWAVAPSAPVIAGTRTVLVVDDDADTVSLLRRVLERRGYEVLGAGSVAEALRVAAGRPFDVLISDVGLPDGSGLDLMERLGCPKHAIALTGASAEDDVARVRAAGFRRHLTKPVSLSTLEAAISDLLKST